MFSTTWHRKQGSLHPDPITYCYCLTSIYSLYQSFIFSKLCFSSLHYPECTSRKERNCHECTFLGCILLHAYVALEID
uniref:Uncharacterized protein n=1 Tax=Oryza brachyantha TaxID=4533 RepID=J3MJV2_ORYBR